MDSTKFNFKRLFVYLVLSLVLAAPFIYRAFLISEIYMYPDVRQHVLDSVFFLRESFGLTIGDMTVNNIVLDKGVIHIVIHEKYHGFLDKSGYDDLDVDYFVDYSYKTDSFELVRAER